MKKLINIIFALFIFLASLSMTGYGMEQDSKESAKKELELYEFDELVIKVKIQEPEVLFILDEPDINTETFEEDLDFLEKIDDPIIKDHLF